MEQIPLTKCKYTWAINPNDSAITAYRCSNILFKVAAEGTRYKDMDY